MPENKGNVGAEGQKNSSSQEEIIEREVTNAVEQLPDTQQAAIAGIEELLAQLEAAIAASDELQAEEKVEALEQVKALAEAGKNPQIESKRAVAKTAIAVLGGIIGKIPGVPTVVGTWKRIQPEISEIFGLE